MAGSRCKSLSRLLRCVCTPGSTHPSRGWAAWRMVCYTLFPCSTPLTNACDPAPTPCVPSTISAGTTSAGLSCSPIPTSLSHTTGQSLPNSAAAFLDFRSSDRSPVPTPSGASSRVTGVGRLCYLSGGSRCTCGRGFGRLYDPSLLRADEGTPKR